MVGQFFKVDIRDLRPKIYIQTKFQGPRASFEKGRKNVYVWVYGYCGETRFLTQKKN